MPLTAGLLAGCALLAACDRRPDTGAVVVSAIGGVPHVADASRVALDTPARLLMASTAQGLVRFDAAGQIEPGIAERWIVIDSGMSYIFRLREGDWGDGTPVTAEQVVAMLQKQIGGGRGSDSGDARAGARARNPLAPFLTAIDEIVVMTPQVIEVRLSRPRPDLLKLFAQPELALLRLRPTGGTGPFRVARSGRAPLLRPAFDPGQADPDDQRAAKPQEDVRLIGERAARAIARFANRDSDLVSGGRFVDWPLLATTDITPASIRVDPAVGLFGLAIVRRDGFMADAANRAAVSSAIDRSAVTAAIAPNWDAADRILPDILDSAALPQVPAWTLLTQDERRAAARQRVAAWTRQTPGPIELRIALPAGPGATLLYAQVAASLMAIGIVPRRVGIDDAAELKLVDAVAPYDSARWYLAAACVACGDAARAALEEAREAPTLAERGVRIAAADAAMNEDVAFIPLARPLRWSLVTARLSQWQANTRAWHPLNRLRPDTN
ncbi:ABC transporter substrate-binding protein [Sphingomonas sp. HMP9]|uniref:ABC transporter substrate-binding protein n=1 Tax=Sphingomonas sp. HMP9 TaxID=1517554 RepID=UPI00159681D5|nr:ABC transporter substrate-binding protein [Sphingomonas sp. HMP9]BCA64209.1 ABC transporter substrate-binding protein [Sphingomonas sp. HMP9]